MALDQITNEMHPIPTGRMYVHHNQREERVVFWNRQNAAELGRTGKTVNAPSVRTSTFGELLRQYRVDARLTQEELAESAKLSVRGLSNLERGVIHHPRRYTVRALAHALELSPKEESALQAAVLRGRIASAAQTVREETQSATGERQLPALPAPAAEGSALEVPDEAVHDPELLEPPTDVLWGAVRIGEMLSLVESALALQQAAANVDQFAFGTPHTARPYSGLSQAEGVLAGLRRLLTFLAASAGERGMRERKLVLAAVLE